MDTEAQQFESTNGPLQDLMVSKILQPPSPKRYKATVTEAEKENEPPACTLDSLQGKSVSMTFNINFK